MHPAFQALTRQAADERGVALPLALLGLISVSLLVTTALVTSSTELAISNAHQDATAGLYVAEGGLQTYVAARGPALIADTGAVFSYQPPSGGAAEAVDVSVSYLGQRPIPSDGSILRLFSVSATPSQGGGRTVSTLVKQIIPPPIPLDTNVKSAITLGGDLNVNGNAFTVSGRSTACSSSGVQAVRHASDSQISVNNQSHWDNFVGVQVDTVDGVEVRTETRGQAAVENSGLSKLELAREALGLPSGQTLQDLIERVPPTHKWGPRFSPAGGTVREFDGRVDPGEKVAVVDGDGAIVDLEGGSGVLIIVNGDLRMDGVVSFDGIIIVEGNFTLKGTPTVSGALISLDDDSLNEIELDASAIANGHITVQYDKCEIDAAEDAFEELSQLTMTPSVAGTFAWMEMTK